MGGGLLQLVAYGAQDVYLTGNPQMKQYNKLLAVFQILEIPFHAKYHEMVI